jgi:hypothetical protein
MCTKCEELDHKIDHCRYVAACATDDLTLEAIDMLVESYCEEKRAQHSGGSRDWHISNTRAD